MKLPPLDFEKPIAELEDVVSANAYLGAGPIRQVMRSSNLSACFELPLLLFRHGERYTARAALLSLR